MRPSKIPTGATHAIVSKKKQNSENSDLNEVDLKNLLITIWKGKIWILLIIILFFFSLLQKNLPIL